LQILGAGTQFLIDAVEPELASKIKIKTGKNCVVRISGIKTINQVLLIEMADNCILDIGPGQHFSGAVGIIMGEPSQVSIGEDCLWGETRLWTSDFHSLTSASTGRRLNAAKSITIGDHCWFGNESLILKGAKVGASSVIAARSTVLEGDYPSNVLLAGTPATVVRRDISWNIDLVT
jgi:acetyltransferase-like isoleucine patch superfamily enzyme